MAGLAFPIAGILVALGAVALVQKLVQELRSPLRKIPSPTLGAGLSRLLWAFPHEYQGTVTIDLPRLHKTLGPLIRIGPNEVSFYSMDTYNVVHKVGRKFKKDPRTYGEFVQEGHPALFSITDPIEHAKRRRVMGQLFSRSKVPQLESLIASHVDHFVEALKHRGPLIDLTEACRALEADIISDFSFGTAIGAINAWKQGRILDMVAVNDEKATWMPVMTTFPNVWENLETIHEVLFKVFGFQTIYSKGIRDFQQWCDNSLQLALPKGGVEPQTSKPNLIHTLYNAGLPEETALAEARENLGPGTDTTSATLAHILYALAQNPEYQSALHSDLADAGFPTDLTALESLPRLQAIVKEGIRWAGAAAAMLPRIVPAGGIELHGKFIPEGSVLTSSPIWYLHDSEAFPDPHICDPFRWLSGDGTALTEDRHRDLFYIPFSKGANICLGSHFAYLELYLSVSLIIRGFRWEEPSGESASSIDNTQHHSWRRVPLPKRLEWVAAVPTESLSVVVHPRH